MHIIPLRIILNFSQNRLAVSIQNPNFELDHARINKIAKGNVLISVFFTCIMVEFRLVIMLKNAKNFSAKFYYAAIIGQ